MEIELHGSKEDSFSLNKEWIQRCPIEVKSETCEHKSSLSISNSYMLISPKTRWPKTRLIEYSLSIHYLNDSSLYNSDLKNMVRLPNCRVRASDVRAVLQYCGITLIHAPSDTTTVGESPIQDLRWGARRAGAGSSAETRHDATRER